jgi:hypothetical protein
MNTNINIFMMIVAIGWAFAYGACIAVMAGMVAFALRRQLRLSQFLNIASWSAAVVMLIAYLELLTSA